LAVEWPEDWGRDRTGMDIALQDDVLTWPEAKVILESAGEKAEPDE
jgi:hypothetical protein